MKQVGPKEAQALLDAGWVYLDVRTPEEFQRGRPAGAVNVPFALAGPKGMAPNPAFVAQVEAQLGKGKKIVCGCQAGGRSAKATAALVAAGFTELVDQRAGFGGNGQEPGWEAAGLPVERG
jgi:rhodanese-related sulfurtransferase